MSTTGDKLAFNMIHAELCSVRDRLDQSINNHSMSPTVYVNLKETNDDIKRLIALLSKSLPKR